MATSIDRYREGVKLKDAKEFEPAAGKLLEAIAADEKFAIAYHALVQCYTESGKHPEAIAAAQKCIELEPDDYFSYIALSRAYQRAGMIPEAELAMMQGQQAQLRSQPKK